MNGTDRFDRHHWQILKMATSVSGNVWVRTLQIRRAEQLVEWGYLTRVSRSHFRLTLEGRTARARVEGTLDE